MVSHLLALIAEIAQLLPIWDVIRSFANFPASEQYLHPNQIRQLVRRRSLRNLELRLIDLIGNWLG